MLNKIRNDIAHNKVARVVLIAVALGFVVWGTGLQSLSLQKNYTLKVGSAEVSPADYTRAYEMAKQQVKSQFGGQEIPAELMKLFGIEKQVEENLISQAVLENYALKHDIFIDESVVLDLIKQEPAFQNNGKFDKQTYVAALRQAQLNPIEFEKSLIKQVQANLVSNLFRETVKVSDTELNMQVKHNQERRDIEVLTLAHKDITSIPEATEEELNELYETMKENFKVVETRDFNVLTVSKNALAKELTVKDEEVQAYFDENQDEFFTKPEFKVQQILVKDQATADKVLALTDLKANFNKYVTEFSTDKFSKDKNGDMGWLSGDIFGAEFENFVHATKKGDVSTTAIETPFGFHIFKLVDAKTSKLRDFSSVKEKIKADLTQDRADNMLNEKLDAALDMSSAGESLTNIAKQLGFTLQSFKNVNAQGPQSYIATVFETPEGETSQPVELEFDATVLIEVTKITDESVKPLSEVKEQVLASYKTNKTAELLQEKADEVLKSIQENKLSFKDAAKEFKLATAIKSIVSISRSSNQKKEVSDEVAAEAFSAETNSLINKTMSSNGNDIIIVKVLDSYQEQITAEAKENIKKELEISKTNDLYLSFINTLKTNYKVVKNEAMVKQITKQN